MVPMIAFFVLAAFSAALLGVALVFAMSAFEYQPGEVEGVEPAARRTQRG